MEGTQLPIAAARGRRGRLARGGAALWATLLTLLVALVMAPAALAAEGGRRGQPRTARPGRQGSRDLLRAIGQAAYCPSASSSARSACCSGSTSTGARATLPVHKSMLEISELIYETCKTYLLQQGRFLAILWVFIAAIMAVYFGVLNQRLLALQGPRHPAVQHRRHRRELRGGLVRYPDQHVREQPHGVRQPPGQAVPVLPDPPDVGHEHRHAADQRRTAGHAAHPALHPQGLRRGRSSSASPSVSRWAPPRCGSPGVSSPRSPTSAPT